MLKRHFDSAVKKRKDILSLVIVWAGELVIYILSLRTFVSKGSQASLFISPENSD